MFKWILVIIIVVVIGLGFYYYNQLNQTMVNAQEAFSNIDAQLERRNDLIPNLVNTVKGYEQHEERTLTEVTKLRQIQTTLSETQTKLTQAHDLDPATKAQLSNQISDSLKSLFAVAENYPDLKANTNFIALQEELTNTENKIAFARQEYNSCVRLYNQMLLNIPTNWIAHWRHLTPMAYFKAETPAKQVPQVKFD